MFSERDVWRAANLLIAQHGERIDFRGDTARRPDAAGISDAGRGDSDGWQVWAMTSFAGSDRTGNLYVADQARD